MALDLNKLKAKMQEMQNRGKKSSFEKIDFAKVFFKPKEGKTIIRIVPSKFNKDWPIHEVSFFSDIVVKRMVSLETFGEPDPIVQFAKALLKSEDPDDKSTAKKLFPKKRYFVHVVVRGQEYEGTKLWEFGSKVNDQLLKILNDQDYGDITDIQDGTDLTIEGMPASFNGNNYVEPTIIPKRKTSPLTEDAVLLTKLLDEQKDPMSIWKKRSADELKGYLEKWLNPEEEAATTEAVVVEKDVDDVEDVPALNDLPWEDSVATAPVVEEKKTEKKAAKKSAAKKTTDSGNDSTTDKFNKLFSE